MDDKTIVVARVDVTRIDYAAVVAQLLEIWLPAKVDRSELTELTRKVRILQKHFESRATEFTRAGGRDLYFVLTLTDVPPNGPFVIAPVREGGNPRAIAGLLFSGRADGPTEREQAPRLIDWLTQFETCQPLGKFVFCGNMATLARLKQLKPARRPELARAFAAAGDSDAQLLILPSDDQRRVIREMLPQLPAELGGGSGKVLADGFQWAAMGITFPPQLAVSVDVQSQDAAAAVALKRFIEGLLPGLAKMDAMRKISLKFEDLATAIKPAVKEDRLTLTLDQQNGGIAKVVSALRPLIALASTAMNERKKSE